MSKYVIVDTETTGLNFDIHRPIEVAWLTVDLDQGIDKYASPMRFFNMLSHKEIMDSDPLALEINGWTTEDLLLDLPDNASSPQSLKSREWFYDEVQGATLVGANVRFDAQMLMSIMPHSQEPWSHRLLDIQAFYAGIKRTPTVPSLRNIMADLINEAKAQGWDDVSITKPDHTATNDVRCVRDILYILLDKYL